MNMVKYNIAMQTPVGLRRGVINLCKVENQVSGTIDLLGHSKPFEGYVDDEGNCRITGCIITLMNTIQFRAEGIVKPSRIDLKMYCEKNIFRLSGVAIEESEVMA